MPHHAHHHKHRVGGGEGGDSPDLNSAWWKAWVMALRTRAGGPSTMGKDKVLFYAASDTNRSIPASKYIPMATTNEFLFNEADALLPLDNPVYAPGHGGYCQALLSYLGKYRVTFMTLTDTRNPEKARELQDDMETAIAMHSNARAVALKAYKESVESGDPAAQDVGFPIWCDRNFPNVQALEENMRTKTAIFEAYTSGDGKPALTDTFYRNLTRAVTCVPAQPGITMQCFSQQVSDLAEKLSTPPDQPKPQAATEPDPKVSHWRAAYGLDPTYRDTMDRWSRNFETAQDSGSVTLNVEDAMKKSWKDLGFEHVSAGFDAQFASIIRVGVRGSSLDQYESAHVEQHLSDVHMTVHWKEMQLFTVDPGTWNVTDIKETFPLPEKDPKTTGLGKRAHPVQFLCASGVGIKCVLSGKAKEAFDEARKRKIAAGGEANLRICCFGFDASASYDKGDEHNTSTHKYDEKTGTLSIKATRTFGNSVLLGVRARVIDI